MPEHPVTRREFSLAGMLALAGSATAAQAIAAPHAGSRLICAGGKEVFILDLDAAEQGVVSKLWSWSAADAEELSESERKWFGNLDECKTIDDGKQILVCASNSGCGLIDRVTRKLLWHASVTNAHSVEMLPRRRIAVASSLSGDRLVLFDLDGPTPTEPVWKVPLRSAHGLVWDEDRQFLWALGFDELRKYELQNWDTATPQLTLAKHYPLPDDDGHDLRPVPGSDDLVLTTKNAVLLFDRSNGEFRPHPSMAKLAHVKAIDIHPQTGRIVYSVWGPHVALLAPHAQIALRGNTVYKVRWFPTSAEGN